MKNGRCEVYSKRFYDYLLNLKREYRDYPLFLTDFLRIIMIFLPFSLRNRNQIQSILKNFV